MPKKINQKAEKRLRNEEYADKFKPKKERGEKPKGKPVPKFANWCRIDGHPSNCNCEYTSPRSSVGRASVS